MTKAPSGWPPFGWFIGLAVLALGGALSAFVVPSRAVLAVLALAECVALGALLAAIASFRGPRLGASLAALGASLLLLVGIGAGFATAGVTQLISAADEAEARTGTRVDEDYRFRLTRPDRDSEHYTPGALARINYRAAAGMWMDRDAIKLFVFVELPYGRELGVLAREEARLAIGEVPAEVREERVRYLGRDAVRLKRTFARGAFEESTFFLHQGRVYHLCARAERDVEPPGEVWFPQALEAFALLDGEVRDRFDPPVIAADEAPGWRVRDQVYESGDFGVRVRGEGALLVTGDAAGEANGDTFVVLERRHPDSSIGVTALFRGEGDPSDVVADRHAELSEDFLPIDAPPIRGTVAGQEVSFSAYQASTDRQWRYRVGVWVDDTRAIELATWAPTQELADAELASALERVEILSPEEHAALGAELDQAEWHGVGGTWSIRGETLTDHVEGLRWRRPNVRWRVRRRGGFDEAEGTERLVSLGAPALGLRGRIVAAGPTSGAPCDDHEDRVRELVGEDAELPSRSARSLGHAPGCVSARIDPGGDYLFAIATATIEEQVYRAEVWGARRDFDRHASEAHAAVAALALVAPDEAGFEAGAYTDPRMGYSLRSAWPERAPVTEWVALDGGAVGSLVHFAREDESIVLMTAPMEPGLSAEERARELLDAHYPELRDEPGEWRYQDGLLGGRPANVATRRIPFDVGSTTIYRMVARGVLYVMLIDARGRLSPSAAAAGFQLLD